MRGGGDCNVVKTAKAAPGLREAGTSVSGQRGKMEKFFFGCQGPGVWHFDTAMNANVVPENLPVN